jgi:uncharacterized protein YndB with AHSA1/START domain
MRFFRNLLIGIAVLILLAAGAAYLLPRNVIVERDVLVNAPPEEVFQHINSLQAFSEWSPWGDYDPEMQVVYSGPETGVGNTMEWTSDHRNVGTGRQEITDVIENEAVRTSLAFDGMGNAEAWWLLSPEDGGTRVTWGLNSDMGMNPIGRWIGLTLDGLVGADYERGLERLRQTVEG